MSVQASIKAEAETKGTIGIVIPAFGHPQFLAEAVTSACTQVIDQPVQVVVVDDGCRYEETGRTVANLIEQFPGKLYYLRQANTRLPGARNAGVRFLLQLEPDLDAIFFLDADNRIESYALRNYRETLGDDPLVGWAYPDIAFFGLSWGAEGFDICETAPDYSKLKHLTGNISEAGSLVRADVFRQGVYYDETMKYGFEDWDFWLSALGAGFVGKRARNAGFLYRRRPESMLADSRRQEDELISRMRRKHAALYRPRAVMAVEHQEAPYFAIVLTDADRVLLTSDPLAPAQELDRAAFLTLTSRWQDGETEFFYPDGVLLLSADMWAQMQAQPMYLRWLFWTMKEQTVPMQRWLFEARATPRLEGISPETPIMGNTVLYLSAEGLQSLLISKSLDDSDIADFAPFVMQAPKPLVAGKTKADLSALFEYLMAFCGDVRDRRPYGFHSNRRYAGPATANIRKKLVVDVCAEKRRKPYPAATDGRRTLLAVDQAILIDAASRARFMTLLERVHTESDEILLVVEQAERRDLALMGVEEWEPLITDLVMLEQVGSGEEYRTYLGRRIYSLFTLQSKEDGSLLSRLADKVITVGAPAFLEVLGDARQHGVKGYVYFEDCFGDLSALMSQDSAKVLAFEHAEEGVVIDDEASVHALAAQGFPPAKCISSENFFKLISQATG